MIASVYRLDYQNVATVSMSSTTGPSNNLVYRFLILEKTKLRIFTLIRKS
jgi:hypothetical protein